MKLLRLMLIMIPSCCQAQFNDSTNYFLNFSGSGNINRTNLATAYVFNNSVRGSIQKKHTSFNITNQWLYGEQQQVLTNNDISSVFDANRYLNNERLYFWGLGNYEKSFSLQLNNRFQGGSGIGYNIIHRDNAVLIISNGVLYEYTNFLQVSEEGQASYHVFRNSFRIKFRWVIKDIFVIDGSDYIQHSFADRSDYVIRSNTNASLKLNRWLSFTFSVTYNKMNITARENLLITYGLTLERYF